MLLWKVATSSYCVLVCAALGTQPTGHSESCAKIQVASWRWRLYSPRSGETEEGRPETGEQTLLGGCKSCLPPLLAG